MKGNISYMEKKKHFFNQAGNMESMGLTLSSSQSMIYSLSLFRTYFTREEREIAARVTHALSFSF